MSSVTTNPALAEQATYLHSSKPSFLGLVRGELFKAVRQWTPWIALVLLLGLILLPYLLLFTLSGLSRLIASPTHDYFYGRAAIGLALLRAFGGIAIVVVTARIIGQEYSLGTIRIVLARGVGRVQLLLAKMTAAVVLAIALLVIGLVEILLVVALQVQIISGSLNALTSLPASVWHDLGLYLLSITLSMAATILMATAISVLFRSLAGGLSGSLVWFPTDNALTLMLLLMTRLTGSTFWLNITAYLLGPNLNIMAGKLANQDGSVWNFGFGPEVSVDSNHVLLTTLIYAVIFLAVALILTWKRDVKE
jgi:ABC-type transport system involved in multi-copper enzyme maturation permease subunit